MPKIGENWAILVEPEFFEFLQNFKICIFSVIYYYQILASSKKSGKSYAAFLRKSFVSRYDGCRTKQTETINFRLPEWPKNCWAKKSTHIFFDENHDSCRWKCRYFELKMANFGESNTPFEFNEYIYSKHFKMLLNIASNKIWQFHFYYQISLVQTFIKTQQDIRKLILHSLNYYT